ncbi:MAG: phage tail protein [Planctomycetes bacterium]|nr:phage tail protein [Planctomycetota bacterium]
MALSRNNNTLLTRAAVRRPGMGDGALTSWKDATGGALLLVFSDNQLPGYGSIYTGTHRYEPVVLRGELSTDAIAWILDSVRGQPAKRDVLVETYVGSSVKSSRTYRDAVLVAYQGPQFDASSKDVVSESISFIASRVD